MMKKTTWLEKIHTEKRPALKENIVADVVIIGGGLAGMWNAYLLSKKGKKVVLLDAKQIPLDAVTSYTTAFITQEIDTSLTDLESMFGKKAAKQVWQSGESAIDLIEEVVTKEKIDCEFMRCSAYIYAPEESQVKYLQQDHQKAQHYGFRTILHPTSALQIKNEGVWEIPNQAKYHPLKFLMGLMKKAREQDTLIFENTEALSIRGNGPVRVATKNGPIVKADHCIVTTYKPFNNPKNTHFKKGMYISYVMEVQIPRGHLPEAIYWDMADLYNYFRIDSLDSKYDRMIIGGADHRAEIKMSPQKNFKALTEYIEEVFGNIEYKIVNKWSGPILEPTDGLPLIGEYSPHRYLATAFSGNGMTYSAISGMIMRDLIFGKSNEWVSVYDPKRKMKAKALLKKGRDYTKEFFGGAVRNIVRRTDRKK